MSRASVRKVVAGEGGHRRPAARTVGSRCGSIGPDITRFAIGGSGLCGPEAGLERRTDARWRPGRLLNKDASAAGSWNRDRPPGSLAMTAALLIVLGIAAAAVGGDLFVRGTVGLARRLRVAPGIIGATVAAFATSSAELSVGINSAVEGSPEIALGDALGSNVVNVGLVLAIAIVLAPIRPRRADLNRDLPVALIAPLMTIGLAGDGTISRLDGGILLASFVGWLVVTIRQAVRERDATAAVLAEHDPRRITRDAVIGLVLLVMAGRLIVIAAKDIGTMLGWDTFTVGALLVAFGTSTPELATVVMARIRGHDEVSVGTVLGSNIFNGLLVIGCAAVISPIRVATGEVVVAVVVSVLTLLLILPSRSYRLGRGRGFALLGVYSAYLAS